MSYPYPFTYSIAVNKKPQRTRKMLVGYLERIIYFYFNRYLEKCHFWCTILPLSYFFWRLNFPIVFRDDCQNDSMLTVEKNSGWLLCPFSFIQSVTLQKYRNELFIASTQKRTGHRNLRKFPVNRCLKRSVKFYSRIKIRDEFN